MNHHTPHLISRIQAGRARGRAAWPLTGLLAAGVLLAGCGASSHTQTSGTPSAGGSSFGAKFVAFASCMRAHGVPGYPDPHITSSAGQVHVQISPGNANPNGPAFRSADAACHGLLPNGGAPAGGASAQQKAQGLKFADCMRAHGVPDFPDPSKDGAFDLPPGVNPNAPTFTSGVSACKSAQPSSLSINQS